MIAIVDALMFRPPALVQEPDRLVAVGARNYVEYETLAARATAVDLSAYTSQMLRVGTGVDAIAVRAECVTALLRHARRARRTGANVQRGGHAAGKPEARRALARLLDASLRP
jgi:hypothetical protein